jgi:GntR family transcriptional regulator
MIYPPILDSLDVDRNLPVPLYYQLREALLTLIKEGQLKEGDLVPTERELGEKFQVSRITVRRAIDELVREGYLVTYQGKGTFVARPKIQRHMTHMKSFSEEMAEEGHRPGSRLLSVRHERAVGYLASALNVTEETWIWVVERLRLADDEPICISSAYLNLPPDVSLTPAELQQHVSLWSILEKKGIFLSTSEETIQAAAAGEREANLLEVEVGSPLLLVEGIVYSDQGVPIEYHQIFNRGDRYTYSVRTVRSS